MNIMESLGQAHRFNIWTIGAMDRTSAQPQVKLSLLRSNSSKFQPQLNSFISFNWVTSTLRRTGSQKTYLWTGGLLLLADDLHPVEGREVKLQVLGPHMLLNLELGVEVLSLKQRGFCTITKHTPSGPRVVFQQLNFSSLNSPRVTSRLWDSRQGRCRHAVSRRPSHWTVGSEDHPCC